MNPSSKRKVFDLLFFAGLAELLLSLEDLISRLYKVTFLNVKRVPLYPSPDSVEPVLNTRVN